MASMSVSEFRADLRRSLDRVEAGEVLEITRGGRVIAVLVEPSQLRRRARTDAVIAAERLGIWLEEARTRPVRHRAKGLTNERAEELVRSIRDERDGRG
jgi:prevent-host-death family protein